MADLDRTEFGDRQAEMSARWYENVKNTHGDVGAYIRKRQDAYLDRWKEAGRFIEDGANILDIGGGNIYEKLIEYIKNRRFKYNYVDVDPSAVDGSRSLAENLGLKNSIFQHGFNDKLNHPDVSFDAIFSSHCIEHSIDLRSTLLELNRVLRMGGCLLMAVPFGWEENPEHPYFLGPMEWIGLIEDAGFEIRVAQVGFEYPEHGADYFIAARKIGSPAQFRIDPSDYRKDNFSFFSCESDSVNCIGEFQKEKRKFLSLDVSSVIKIDPPVDARVILPILHRHPWSGIVKLSAGATEVSSDLYSWYNFDMPVPFWDFDGPVTIKSVGKNPMSRWSQFVFKGYMWR